VELTGNLRGENRQNPAKGGTRSMPRSRKKRSKKIGLAPGTLVHIGEKKVEKVRLRLIDYDVEKLQEQDLDKIEECFPLKDKPTVTWVNIDGIHSTMTIIL
jgi:magnesium transporter